MMEKITLPELPVLDDFALFLTFLRSHGQIAVTSSNAHLKQADLFRLNEEMHFKAKWVTAKSMQPHYPLLDLFYQVVLVGKLARIYHEKRGIYLKVNPEQLEEYDLMTRTEQYFFLLESVWCRLNWAELTGTRSLYFANDVFEVLLLMAVSALGETFDVQDGKINMPGSRPIYLRGNAVIYQVFWFLGFYDLEPDTSLTKKPDRYSFPFQKIIARELSQHLVPVLLEQRPLEVWNLPATRETDMLADLESIMNLLAGGKKEQEQDNDMAEEAALEKPEEPFIQAFKPLFAPGELSESLCPQGTEFIGGRYTIKVALSKKLYRTIVIGASATLEDLHLIIQEAFAFDDDHLYGFFMDGKVWSDNGFYDPRGEEGPFADEVKLGELDLYAGKRFVYLFDFGDCWLFEVLVQQIETQAPEPGKATVAEEKGEAPQQYEDYEGDDW